MSAQVDVVVVSWNTKELLRTCLRSLAPDLEDGFATVTVVDNCSTDGSADLVEEEFERVRLIRAGENLGFGRAVNLGAEGTSAPWVAPANADIAFRPGSLRALVESGEAVARAGAVAPRLELPDGRTQHSVHSFPGIRLGLALHFGLTSLSRNLGNRLLIEGAWDPERRRFVDWAHGAFLLVRRSAWETVGGFDPEQWMYAEDLDLCWRLRRSGWACLYEPDAAIRHEESASARKAFDDDERRERHLVAALTWFRRRKGAIAAASYAAINWAGAGIRQAGLAPFARVSPNRFGTTRNRYQIFSRVHGQQIRPLLLGSRSTEGFASVAPGVRRSEASQVGDSTQLRERFGAITWYHTQELAPGLVTPGMFDLRPLIGNYGIPDDLSGKRVLDVGTFEGFWAFELERRGAEVVALDIDRLQDLDWPPRLRPAEDEQRGEGFQLAKEALGSKVERVGSTIYEATPEKLGGTFDLVFCGSVLIHVRDPMLALERMAALSHGRLILADECSRRLRFIPFAAAEFRGETPWMTWWRPSVRTWLSMIRCAGFDDVGKHSTFDMKFRDKPGGVPHVVVHAKGGA